MQSRSPFPHTRRGRRGAWAAARLAALAALGAAAALGFGCSETRPTGAPLNPNASVIGDHPLVLNTQLRPVGASTWDSFSPGGHAQFKVYSDGSVRYTVFILNLQCIPMEEGGVYLPAVQGQLPSPEDRAVIDIRVAADAPCGDIPLMLQGSATIPEEIAAQMYNDPEEFVAAFFGVGGGLIAGTLQIGTLNEAPTR